MTTTTKTVGRGKSKGMLVGRQAAAKAKANAQRVADINAQRVADALSRTACIQYLQTHGIYSGHSRDSVEQLRQLVAEHRTLAPQREAANLAKPGATPVHVPGDPNGVVLQDAGPELLPDGPARVAAAKAEHKALQAWIKDGEQPPRPATPNLDAMNADYAAGKTAAQRHRAAKGTGAGTGRVVQVPADHPLLRYVDEAKVGQPVPAELGLVHTVDGAGLVRVHKATCKPEANRAPLATWPAKVYAAACCKPRTPGAVARTVYVPPSKRTA